MNHPPTILYSSSAASATVVGDVHVSVYRGALTSTALLGVSESHSALIEEYRGGTCVLSYAEVNTPLPSSDVRRLSSELTRKLSPHIRSSVTVLGGDGFWASAVRSVVTATLVFSRGSMPVKIVSTIEEGAEITAAKSNVPEVTAERLVEALRVLREDGA